MKIRYIILSLLFSYSIIFAQGQAAVPFLLNEQSPLFYGAGEIGTAVPMHDPIGFYYNPAQLGYYSRNNNLSVFFMPDKTTLFNQFNYDVTSNSFGFALGYNFKSNGSNIPLSIGAGFLHNRIDYSQLFVSMGPTPNTTLNSYNSFDCYSFGASYDYYVLFNFGFSLKSFSSTLSLIPTAESPYGNLKATGTAFDFGAMVIAPFDDLFLKNTEIKIENGFFKPILKSTLGYSISNIGKKIYYVDAAQSDPIPRTARLGYSINLGLKTKIAGVELPVIDYSFTAEVEDLLVNSDTLGNSSYQGLFGDINIGNNLILLNGDKNVIIHKGHIFNFFKTLTIVKGGISSGNLLNVTTNGWAVSSEGLFSILVNNISNTALSYLFRHFDFEYYHSSISAGPYLNPKPSGFAVYFKGIDL